MKAHFYGITHHDTTQPPLDACLEHVFNSYFQAHGHYEPCDTHRYRLENFQRTADYCTGDFVRQQNTDIPPHAPDGSPLQPNHTPSGHQTAFLYHHATHALIVQANRNGAGPSGIIKLVKQKMAHAGFQYLPVFSQAAMNDLLDGSLRRITVKFAAPANLAAVEVPGNDMMSNLRRMQQSFAGTALEITCGFENRKRGALNVEAIVNFLHSLHTSPVQTRKIQAKRQGESGLIDLLGQKHTYEENNLTLTPGDIQQNYAERRAFLLRALTRDQAFIIQYFAESMAA